MILRLTLCAAVCCVAPASKSAAASAGKSIGPAPVGRVAVAKAQQQKLATTITGFGRVQAQPVKVVAVDAPRAATISKVFVRLGQTVAQGGPIAQLTTSPATGEAFRKAQSAFKFAQGKVQRARTLYKEGAGTKVALDQAQVAYGKAKRASRRRSE